MYVKAAEHQSLPNRSCLATRSRIETPEKDRILLEHHALDLSAARTVGAVTGD